MRNIYQIYRKKSNNYILNFLIFICDIKNVRIENSILKFIDHAISKYKVKFYRVSMTNFIVRALSSVAIFIMFSLKIKLKTFLL